MGNDWRLTPIPKEEVEVPVICPKCQAEHGEKNSEPRRNLFTPSPTRLAPQVSRADPDVASSPDRSDDPLLTSLRLFRA